MKKVLFTAIAAMLLAAVSLSAAAQKPTTVLHVVTIKWKTGTTPEQISSALKGAEAIANTYAGVTRVWTRSIKVQGDGYTHALVMEFKDEKALTDYADSAAQKEWYKIYLPLREESTTHDITN